MGSCVWWFTMGCWALLALITFSDDVSASEYEDQLKLLNISKVLTSKMFAANYLLQEPGASPSKRLHDHHIGIPVGAALEPPLCPPPPVTRSQGICFLTKCITNMDCPRGKACCFNGCVRTCTDPLDYPAAFDWVEDTSRILPILGPDFESVSPDFMPILVPQHASGYAAAEGGEELVHLPGGCLVSASKHKKLKEFAKASSIKECLCVDGEVLCEVIRIQSL